MKIITIIMLITIVTMVLTKDCGHGINNKNVYVDIIDVKATNGQTDNRSVITSKAKFEFGLRCAKNLDKMKNNNINYFNKYIRCNIYWKFGNSKNCQKNNKKQRKNTIQGKTRKRIMKKIITIVGKQKHLKENRQPAPGVHKKRRVHHCHE